MKIISFNRSRTGTSTPPKAVEKKKALLIGINYDTPDSPAHPDFGQLVGPRKDAVAFRDLLIEKYGYAPEDVTVMIDGPEANHLAPTRHNIIAEIERLVRGARPGDRFVFLYSGHSGQIACLEHSEDDDLDEVILPMDHGGLEEKDKLIVDNDLKKLLVDPLPAGAYLTAIFDSCHSGTLLDLEHYHCNNVYHPWISKGERKMKTRWLNNVRKGAADEPGVRVVQPRAATATGVGSLAAMDLTSSIAPPPPKHKFSSLRLRRKMSASDRPRRSSTSVSVDPARGRITSLGRLSGQFVERAAATALELVIPRCMSPVSLSRECDGNCVESPTEKAHVISLAACADPQVDWEDSTGVSMTQMLINRLKEDPHPTLVELMTFISYRRYDTSRAVHALGNKLRKKGKKAKRRKALAAGANPQADGGDVEVPFELVNFQDPQLGSREKLNMNASFTF